MYTPNYCHRLMKAYSNKKKIGWMGVLQFYILFNSISVISGQWADDNIRLCAMEPCLQLRRFRLEQGSNSGPLDQLASPKPTVIKDISSTKDNDYTL